MLQYIVSGSNASQIATTASEALEHGCRWIRVDISQISLDEVNETVKAVHEKCKACEAFLTLENDVEAVHELKVDGVHIGFSTSDSIVGARKQLGEEPIIGITVQHAGDVPFVPRTAIDYLSLEKAELDECRKIVEQMRTYGLDEPVVVPYSPDVPPTQLMDTGINGIAVSNDTIPTSQLPQLLDELNRLLEKRLSNL